MKGKVVKVHIKDNQDVTVGTPLVEIDQEDYLHVLSERDVNISQLQAQDSEIKEKIKGCGLRRRYLGYRIIGNFL
ncbi:MAG: biotin/lipoyl-binding protein [Deltaproteobacteria bacterium]|nr:biotin/lipoyl-binding protein [Deltaproteobacteria bacterium]